MKRTRILTILLTLLILSASLPVQAAELVEPAESNITNSGVEITPKALITSSAVRKWSDSGNFMVQADIVTNDGTGQIIDVKNILLAGWTAKMDNVKEISLSSGSIWDNGSYATVTITYRDNGNICTDIVRFYPYGK